MRYVCLVYHEARDLNEALRLVSRFASAVVTVEVRPILDANAELADPLDQKIAAAVRGPPRPHKDLMLFGVTNSV
jgi:hypothetical protein